MCGIAMFDATGNFTGYEWFGYCDAVSDTYRIFFFFFFFCSNIDLVLICSMCRANAQSARTSVRLMTKKSPLAFALGIQAACCALYVFNKAA